MNIGKTIRNRRKELKLTQQELADRIHVTVQAVSQWENGKTVPDILNFGCIAAALQMDKGALLGEEERNRPAWFVKDQFFQTENMRRKLKEFAAAGGLRQMDRAVDYVLEKFEGMTRDASVFTDEKVPAVNHPFMMTCEAHALGIRSDDVLTTALLHDVCEDCGVEAEDLPFSEEVREAVGLLTKTWPETPESTEQYYERIAENPTAAIVKVLDRCNNISTIMMSFPLDRLIEYVEETERYVLPLMERIKRQYADYYDAVYVLKYQLLSTLESVKAAVLRL